jgi:uncharacterized cupin superfamily protein
MTDPKPVAVKALDVAPRTRPSNYPEPFYTMMQGREKRQLGDVFGLESFGVNLTRLKPGGRSALRHYHSIQDEFIYILSGYATLVTDAGEAPLEPGMCAGFKGGVADGHMLINRGEEDVVYIEIGDRRPGDRGHYPDDDLKAEMVDGQWRFAHKDGSPY